MPTENDDLGEEPDEDDDNDLNQMVLDKVIHTVPLSSLWALCYILVLSGENITFFVLFRLMLTKASRSVD